MQLASIIEIAWSIEEYIILC